MKRIFLTVVICIISLLGVQAQQTDAKPAQPTAEQQVKKMMHNLTTTCNLTPDQVKKIKPIITAAVNEGRANKQKYGSDEDKLKEANQATVKATNAKLNAILTPDQQAKLAAFEKQKKTEMQSKEAADQDKK